MSVIKFIVSTAGLHNAVKNIPHATASLSDYVPVLAAGHLVIRNGNLIMEATDRYKLLQVKVDDLNEQIEKHRNTENEIPFNAELGVIPVDVVKSIEQNIRAEARSKQQPHHLVTVDQENNTITLESLTSGAKQSFSLLEDVEYPKIDSLFDRELPEVVQPLSLVSMQHLQALAKVQHARVAKNSQDVWIYGGTDNKIIRWYWKHEGEV